MHAYLVAVAKQARWRQRHITHTVEQHMVRALRRAVPTPADQITMFTWRRRDHGAMAVVISDEPAQRVVTADTDRLATWTGYFAGRPDTHDASALGLLDPGGREAAVDRLGGVFSAAIVDEHGAQFHTATARVDPVYWCDDPNFVYVSSRALAANLAASGDDKPYYDPYALVGLISAGFFPDESTPFRGVQPLPPAHVLDVRPTQVVCRARSRYQVPAEDAAVDEVGADLARALVESCVALPADTQIRCGLTGGKDSRLIVAALRAAGVDFATQTAGHPDHPDVVVARRLSRLLGVDHTNLSTWAGGARGNTVRVSPLARARDVVRFTEGMLSAYENIAVNPTSAFSAVPVLGGHGGEVLRGGYAKYTDDLTPDGAVRYLEQGFLRNPSVFQDHAFQEYRDRLFPWLTRVHDDPLSGLDEFYLHYRAGRWSAAARTARTTKQRCYQPFFDDRVVAVAHRVPIERRLDERLIHAALRHLAPDLVDVPFAEHRWHFDENRPADARLRSAWQARAPVHAASSNPAATFNWRLGYDDEVQEVFAEQVLSKGPGAMLFEILDRKVVERLLRRSPPRSRQLCWRIFTASVLLSNTWLTSDAIFARTVEIAVPSADDAVPPATAVAPDVRQQAEVEAS